MPVIVYSGPPGAGKSYLACKDILQELEKGRIVWTNFEFKDWVYRKYPTLKKVSETDISTCWAELPKNALLVCEEALIHFPADFGKGNKELQKRFRDWLVYHRHHGQDVWFIVQSWTMLTPIIRAVVDVRREVHNKGHIGFSKTYTGSEYSPGRARHPYRDFAGKYDAKVFEAYQSIVPGANLATKKGKNILTRWYVLTPAIGLLITSLMLPRAFGHYIEADAEQLTGGLVQNHAKTDPEQKGNDDNGPPEVSGERADRMKKIKGTLLKTDEEYAGARYHVAGFANQWIVIETPDRSGYRLLESGGELGGCRFFRNAKPSAVLRVCGSDSELLF